MKKGIIGGIIIIVALIAVLSIYFWPFGEKPTSTECLTAGKLSFDESTGKTLGECCEGLIEIGNVFYNENKTCEEIFMIVGYGSICSDCGNNNCESWENRCNCPEDCA